MTRIVGIDLGTSTSEIAVFELGKPRVILNREGRAVTPSAVWESPSGELIAGGQAYEQAGSVREFKRQMGDRERLKIGAHALAPEECSALLLRYLLQYAEEDLGEEIDRAVITVPASWKDDPRRATEEAGQLAGLRVERLINEPTAAAMAFGSRPEAEGKTIAVYDLGGGTFDVTILRIHDKVFDVVTSVGDPHLGGSDIDKLVMEYVIQQIAASSGYTHVLGKDTKVDWALKLACEAVKKDLSSTSESQVRLPFSITRGGRPVDVSVSVTRQTLEELIAPLVKRSLDNLDEALRQAKLPKGAIDEVVLVGGSTRIPLVRQRVAEHIGKEPNTHEVNPDEAVALGAAIQAGIIDQEDIDDDSYVVMDVTNNDLGVEVLAIINGEPVPGVFSPLIEKNMKLPRTATGSYTTVVENQQSFEVKCYQGRSKWTSQNKLIGEPIHVENLPPRPAGEVEIAITFSLGLSEMLDVGVVVQEAGIAMTQSLSLDRGWNSQEQRDKRQAALDSMWQRSEMAGRYRTLIERAEEKLRSTLPETTATALRTAVLQLKEAIVAANEEAAVQADVALSNLLFDLE